MQQPVFALGDPRRGKIQLFLGPMFSSKTSSMCNMVERNRLAGKRCVVVKYANDTRYDHLRSRGGVINHAGHEYAQEVLTAHHLADVFESLVESYDVIGIDELQFFSDCALVHTLANLGKIVICAGLDGDFNGDPFINIVSLIPRAEDVVKLKAVCMRCRNADASFTDKLAAGGPIVDYGGADKYVAVCRGCKWDAPA